MQNNFGAQYTENAFTQTEPNENVEEQGFQEE